MTQNYVKTSANKHQKDRSGIELELGHKSNLKKKTLVR